MLSQSEWSIVVRGGTLNSAEIDSLFVRKIC